MLFTKKQIQVYKRKLHETHNYALRENRRVFNMEIAISFCINSLIFNSDFKDNNSPTL
jgi:hypothetical protein